jgi:hypothetical protein
MRGAIQPRSVSLDGVEEQHNGGAVHVWVSHHRNRVARLVRLRSPPPGGHDVNSGGLDSPRPHRRRVRRPSPNGDDDVAVWVLPPVVLYDSPICDVLAHVEHRAGMVGECRTSCQQSSDRQGHSQQQPTSGRIVSIQSSTHALPGGTGSHLNLRKILVQVKGSGQKRPAVMILGANRRNGSLLPERRSEAAETVSNEIRRSVDRSRVRRSLATRRLIVGNQGFDCRGLSHFVGTRRCSSSCQFCTTTIVGALV